MITNRKGTWNSPGPFRYLGRSFNTNLMKQTTGIHRKIEN